jgi:predicted dehydrogenase
MGEIVPRKITTLLRGVTERFPNDVDVPEDRQFVGLDAYKKVIDAVGSGGVILLATPPVFRPMEFEYAVEKGTHVFMEKSFGIDPPGVRRVLRAGEAAKEKNLKIVGGLMTRHKRSVQAAIEQIHSGLIGDVMTCWAYRTAGASGTPRREPDESLVAFQIRYFNNFKWLFGSQMVDWLIHNLDVCCWAKGAYPVSAQGQCARQLRRVKDQLFDQYAVEYAFPDGTRFHDPARYMRGTWNCFQATIHGTTGCAVLGEGISQPMIYKGHNPERENVIWEYRGPRFRNEYQAEHDVLFDCIRNDKPHNETERCAHSSMVGILGRMAAESGQLITWEDAFKSDKSLAPNIDLLTLDGPSPAEPDENGDYAFPIPGQTEVV